jgi:hypothetical protein
VVVLAADVVGILPLPSKRDSVLAIHRDGVTACLVALQGVQVVARRNLEVVEPRDQVELFQFPLGGGPCICGQIPLSLDRFAPFLRTAPGLTRLPSQSLPALPIPVVKQGRRHAAPATPQAP